MVVRQVVPGVAAGAVVLADGAPLTFTDVGAPQIPVAGLAQPLVESAEALDPLPFCARSHGDVDARSGFSTVARVRAYMALSIADSASSIADCAKSMASSAYDSARSASAIA